MEDKWDIYLFDGVLYFARSWTGDLSYCAESHFDTNTMQISSVVAAGNRDSKSAPRVVDYLIKSHIFGRDVPHPLPADLPKVANQIAAYSFSMFGRRCSFGTYADTIAVEVPADRRT